MYLHFFLYIIFVLFLGLVYTAHTNIDEDADEYHVEGVDHIDLKEEVITLLVSKVAMFPILIVEVAIYVSLNCGFIWIWFCTGEREPLLTHFSLSKEFVESYTWQD